MMLQFAEEGLSGVTVYQSHGAHHPILLHKEEPDAKQKIRNTRRWLYYIIEVGQRLVCQG